MPSFAIGAGPKRRLVTLASQGSSLLTERRWGEKVTLETDDFASPEEAARELRQRSAALLTDGYREVDEVAIGARAQKAGLDPAEAAAELERLLEEARGDEETLALADVLRAWRTFGALRLDCEERTFGFDFAPGEEQVTLDLWVDCLDARGAVRVDCELQFPPEEELAELEPESFTQEGPDAAAFLDAAVDTEAWQALSRHAASEVTVESWRLD